MVPRLPSPATIWFVIATLGLVVCVDGCAWWLCEQARSQTLFDKERELRSLSTVLADQSERAFQALETVQDSMVEAIGAPALIDPPDVLDAFLRSRQMHEALADKISALPYANVLALFDSKGTLINFSRQWPVPNINISDREHFKAALANAHRKTFIGAPTRSRTTGAWTIFVTRQIDLGEQGFKGIVLCGIDLTYFERLYESLSLGAGSAIALYRQDGTLLTRYPTVDTIVGSVPASSEAFKKTAAEGGSRYVRHSSLIDGEDRFISMRAIPRYGLVIAVSTKVAEVVEPWRTHARHLAGAVALLDVLIGVAAFLALRQRRMYRQARFDAHHDALTGLANRAGLADELFRRFDAQRSRFTLVLVDLDHFKNVNDCAGHAAGDLLLKAVAAMLKQVTGPDDLVVRLGGDEFALLLSSAAGQAGVDAVLAAIFANLAHPIPLDGFAASISASMGVVFSPLDGQDASELLRKADLALYAAKADGRRQWRVYETFMDEAIQAQQAIETGLRAALPNGELELYLQPIVDVQLQQPIGFEALVRWNHPTRGLIPPGDFIPVAEKSGLIVPLGEWVIRQACWEAARWTDGRVISVNVSAVQLLDTHLLALVADALAVSGLAAHRLELEITETVFLERNRLVSATLRGLQKLGVKIALDDFGTGFSSLQCLVGFPFDRVKIDQSFVRGMETSVKNRAIVRMVIGLARDTGLAVTAEGVETRAQLDQLRSEGCTIVQGFYFSRPLPIAEAVAFAILAEVATAA